VEYFGSWSINVGKRVGVMLRMGKKSALEKLRQNNETLQNVVVKNIRCSVDELTATK
jgi:hypothetical protein